VQLVEVQWREERKFQDPSELFAGQEWSYISFGVGKQFFRDNKRVNCPQIVQQNIVKSVSDLLELVGLVQCAKQLSQSNNFCGPCVNFELFLENLNQLFFVICKHILALVGL
jgi:hypothetical protein